MLHTAPFAAVMHLFLFAHPALVHMAVQATPEALEKFKEFMRGLVDLLLENLERRFWTGLMIFWMVNLTTCFVGSFGRSSALQFSLKHLRALRKLQPFQRCWEPVTMTCIHSISPVNPSHWPNLFETEQAIAFPEVLRTTDNDLCLFTCALSLVTPSPWPNFPQQNNSFHLDLSKFHLRAFPWEN
jgi:hypothetical protein